jgi:Fe-S cluster assembly protein SufD
MSRTASIEATGWLIRLRAEARARFDVLGIPKPTDEDWRHTNVQPVAPFAATAAGPAKASAAAVDALPLAAALPHRAVLVNGHYDERLSTLSGLPRGVSVRSLATALADTPSTLEPHVGRAASGENAAFVALNTALFSDGIVVTVDAGVEVAAPLHIVHVAVPGPNPTAIHPRTLVHAREGSQLTLVESFVSLQAGTYLTNSVTEIIAEASAHVTHVKIQSEGASGWHVATVAAHQARDAQFVSHNVSFGAALARHDIGSRLDGPGAECRLYGLYVVDGAQHVDNHTWLDHAMPNCPSWEMYKGLLAGAGKAVFNGRIVVREGAQKTDAKQSNKNLILGDQAVVHTRPQLEIHANDVKCTHGATIGRLDDAALFYLRTRGIGKDEARSVLIRAFAEDLIDNIPIREVREYLSDVLHVRLEGGLRGVEAVA